MTKPKLILVGGFLGAGKTTLLWRAAEHLAGQGRRVGLITNDQAPQLVDTGFLSRHGFQVGEIAGGCFCCRFQNLIETAETLIARMQPDVLIAEPVGSCTDLSATVIQPVKDLFPEKFEILPFSVLVEPHRLAEILGSRAESGLHPSARYILEKQLEEADRIVLNKNDTLDEATRENLLQRLAARYPGTPVSFLSALDGSGVGQWLEAVLTPGQQAGGRVVPVDYDVYAEGEAVLGWLNATASIVSRKPEDWLNYCVTLMRTLQEALRERQAEVAHLKVLLVTDRGFYVSNLTHRDGECFTQGTVVGEPREAELVINARVEMGPDELGLLVEKALARVTPAHVLLESLEIKSLRPGRPVPVHRYSRVV